MTKKIEYLFLALIALQVIFGVSNSSAQTAKHHLEFEGIMNDPQIDDLPNGQTEVVIILSKYPFNQMYMQSLENQTHKFNLKNREGFKISTNLPARRCYLFIFYRTKKVINEKFWSYLDNIYMVEGGDKLKCILSKHSFSFEGKGAKKLNCQTDIYSAKVTLDPEKSFQLRDSKNYKGYIDALNACEEQTLQKQLAILHRYQAELSVELYNIFLANCIGQRYYSKLRGYRLMADNYSFFKEALASDGYLELNSRMKIDMAEKTVVQSPLYTDALFEDIMLQSRTVKDGQVEANINPSHISKTFDCIIKNYPGAIKDKLLALFFTQWATQPSIPQYYDKAISLMSDTLYMGIVTANRNRYLTGRPFYNFKMENTTGNVIKLEDLKEKTLIIDFWYTGCPGCSQLKTAMQGIWEYYKADDRVKFVSICIDKDKNAWIESVNSIIYTEPEAINLYTGGLGKNHPVIREMEISYFPRMFVVKDGKIFSAVAPWPDSPDVEKGTTKDFVKLIESSFTK